MGRSRKRWRASDNGPVIEEVVVGSAVAGRLDDIHAALERFWTAIDKAHGPRPRPEQRTEFAIGLVEIAANVIRHAYPPSRPPGDIHARLHLYTDRLEAVLTDHGQPFVQPEANAAVEPGAPAEGGYGLPLTRRALDRVEYRRDSTGLNTWRLVKYL